MSLVTVQEHLEHILGRLKPLPVGEQSLLDSVGQPVARDLRAPIPLPVFSNSAMDGYAVRHRDVVEADERPVHLPVVGEIAAGTNAIFDLVPGTAVRIMTGGEIPAGCDAVVPVEWTDDGDETVLISKAPQEGQHIRIKGEEIAQGETVMQAGEVVTVRHLGLLASLGYSHIPAAPRPRVVVLSTGTELVEPGRIRGRDQIFDSNSYLLAAAVKAHGGIPYRARAATDDPNEFADHLGDQLVRADMIVTSGGVSMGRHDVVKEVLQEVGTVWFGGVAMQPGKPQGFGVIGEDEVPIFTLPGNPVSAYISFEMFVVPAMRALVGGDPVRNFDEASVTEPLRSTSGKRQFLRGRCSMRGDGMQVEPVGGPGSHLVGGLAAANCLIVIPEEVTGIERGAKVQILRLSGAL